MKVIFITDFQGVETNEMFFRRGDVAELDDDTAARLITDKRAEAVPDAQPEQEQRKARRK